MLICEEEMPQPNRANELEVSDEEFEEAFSDALEEDFNDDNSGEDITQRALKYLAILSQTSS